MKEFFLCAQLECDVLRVANPQPDNKNSLFSSPKLSVFLELSAFILKISPRINPPSGFLVRSPVGHPFSLPPSNHPSCKLEVVQSYP